MRRVSSLGAHNMLFTSRKISANLSIVSSHNNSVSSLLPQSFWTRFRRYCVFVSVVLLTATIFSVGGLKVGAVRIEPAIQNQPATPQEYSVKRIPVERTILGPKGFAPSDISRPKGPFILAIHNRAKIDDLNLSLAKVAGNKLREM